MKKLLKTLHYCKADKKTGKPIVITSPTGKTRNTNMWSMTVYDRDGKPMRLRMEFNNSKGKAKRQGATTVLEVWK